MGDWAKVARRIRVPLGFAFAAFYLWIARPSAGSITLGVLIAIPGIVLRAIASGHVKKNEELTTTGPYAYSRNPLYLGSLIMAIGFAVASRSGWVLFVIVVILFAVYFPVIRSEEEFLRHKFPEFDSYAQSVPRLLPRLRPFARGKGGFSSSLYWQHREYNAILGTVAVIAVLVVKLVWIAK